MDTNSTSTDAARACLADYFLDVLSREGVAAVGTRLPKKPPTLPRCLVALEEPLAFRAPRTPRRLRARTTRCRCLRRGTRRPDG